MPIIPALPATKSKLAVIAGETLVHVTDPAYLSEIVVDRTPNATTIGENCTVHLKARQGWAVAKRFFRDYSILDPFLIDRRNWGKYVYFFLGEPSRWARFKNLNMNPLRSWEQHQKSHTVIRILGANLVAQAGQPTFYRVDDKVVVVRGEYRGPAKVTPEP